MDTPAHTRRTGLAVGGAIVALLAALVLAVAGVAIWTDVDKRDGSGYLSTNAHRYATPTAAIASEEITIGPEIPKRLLGDVRVHASSAKRVFVGIARTEKVAAYLAGTSYATAQDLDLDPFAVTYVTHDGSAQPRRPANATFWDASTVGTDARLDWRPRTGSWAVVVMNADGSRGVSADVRAGVELGWLLWAGIGTAAGGLGLLALGVRMLVRALRRPPRADAGAAPAPAV